MWPRDWSSDVCSSDLRWVVFKYGDQASHDQKAFYFFVSLANTQIPFSPPHRGKACNQHSQAGRVHELYTAQIYNHIFLSFVDKRVQRSEEHTSELQSRGHLV